MYKALRRRSPSFPLHSRPFGTRKERSRDRSRNRKNRPIFTFHLKLNNFSRSCTKHLRRRSPSFPLHSRPFGTRKERSRDRSRNRKNRRTFTFHLILKNFSRSSTRTCPGASVHMSADKQVYSLKLDFYRCT